MMKEMRGMLREGTHTVTSVYNFSVLFNKTQIRLYQIKTADEDPKDLPAVYFFHTLFTTI